MSFGNEAGVVPCELVAWSAQRQEFMCAVPMHPLRSAEAVTLQQPAFIERELGQAALEAKPQGDRGHWNWAPGAERIMESDVQIWIWLQSGHGEV